MNGVRIAAIVPGGASLHYFTDQVDSVKVVVNDSGLPVSRMEYKPYGETWFQEGEENHTPKYNSQELDKETGYYFYNARYYDPEIARFVTADNVVDGQFDTQGWNRYSYVKNNPILYKDPTGHAGVADDLWSGIEERASEYGKAASSAYKTVKEAVSNPRETAGKVIQRVENELKEIKKNPKEYAKEAGKAYVNAVADTYKEMTGIGRASRIVNAENPVKQVGKELTDIGVEISTAIALKGAGKLLDKAGKVVSEVDDVAKTKILRPADDAVKEIRYNNKIDPWKDTHTSTKDVSRDTHRMKTALESAEKVQKTLDSDGFWDMVEAVVTNMVKKDK